MAERVGFDALNAQPCTALLSLVRLLETQGLFEFHHSPRFAEGLWNLIPAQNVARQWRM
jgi:hypothetical protein